MIVGEAVGDIYKEVDSQLNLSEADADQDTPEPSSSKNLSVSAKAKHAFNSLIGVITVSMMPINKYTYSFGNNKKYLNYTDSNYKSCFDRGKYIFNYKCYG